MNVGNISFALQVFLPTVGAQVQGELICLSRKETLHSCFFQHRFRKKPVLLSDPHAFSSLWVFFFLWFKVINVKPKLPNFNVSFFIWPCLHTSKWYNPLLACTSMNTWPDAFIEALQLQRKSLFVERCVYCSWCCGLFLFMLKFFFFNVWCQTLQRSSWDLSCTV